jgi:hypothetical protein
MRRSWSTGSCPSRRRVGLGVRWAMPCDEGLRAVERGSSSVASGRQRGERTRLSVPIASTPFSVVTEHGGRADSGRWVSGDEHAALRFPGCGVRRWGPWMSRCRPSRPRVVCWRCNVECCHPVAAVGRAACWLVPGRHSRRGRIPRAGGPTEWPSGAGSTASQESGRDGVAILAGLAAACGAARCHYV